MTVTVRYIGTTSPYFETAVTGKPGKWSPGSTGDVSDGDAALLIATGLFEVFADRVLPFAFNSAGGIAGVRLPSGAIASMGTGSGAGASSGSDMTDATVSSDGILTYTAGGVPWVVTYSGGVPVREALAQAPTLGADLVDAGGGNYIVDPADTDAVYFQNGALRMTLAQRNTWLAANGGNPTIGRGFKIFVTDVGSIIDAAGNATVPGAHAVYVNSTYGFQWQSGVQYAAYQAGTTINAAAGALAISRQLDIAATVVGPYDQLLLGVWYQFPVTGGATKSVRVQVNSSTVYLLDMSGIALGATQYTAGRTINGVGPSSQITTNPAAGYDASAALGALVTGSIDLSAALAITARATVTGSDTAVCRLMTVMVQRQSGIFG